MKMYEVGGCVRDEILGVPSKDIDFSVVLDNFEANAAQRIDPFQIMVGSLKSLGFQIFLESPEHLTVRARFPRYSNGSGFVMRQAHSGLTADFVLARREGKYSDGRRPDSVVPGTLMDDLARRDFTMNAIAKDADGRLIDPFDGVKAIQDGLIKAVGDPFDRLNEDALRAVRALRFSVTKGFHIAADLQFAMESVSVINKVAGKQVSDERIREELSKMFRHDTVASLYALRRFPALTEAMFSGSVSLDSTMKTKGRNVQKPVQGKKNLPSAKNGCTCNCHIEGGRHISKCC